MDLAAMREQYGREGLDVADVAADPFAQFADWFAAWASTEPFDANTVILSTVDADGGPTARAVLLKGADERGFVFYTNRNSDKGRHLEATGRAALNCCAEVRGTATPAARYEYCTSPLQSNARGPLPP